MLIRMLLMLSVLALTFGAIFAWKNNELNRINAQMGKIPSAVVSAQSVKIEKWESFLPAVGSLTASKGVSVTNEVAGQVSRILFVSGQRIKQDDLLLQLNDSVDQAELKGLMAEHRLAELQLKRDKQLLKDSYMSRSAYDEALTRLDNTAAQVESKRALIAKKQIRAPFSGWIGIRQIDLGEFLAPGADIVTLQSLDPIYADYTVPERYIGLIHSEQPIQIQVQGYPDDIFDGHISAIAPIIDTETRSVTIRATLSNPNARLRPGMFAQIKTILPSRDQILTVPETAITYAPYGDSVFVVQRKNGNLTVRLQTVKTGQVQNSRVEIIEGLEPNQEVVTAGQIKLRNGMPVRIDNSIELNAGITTP